MNMDTNHYLLFPLLLNIYSYIYSIKKFKGEREKDESLPIEQICTLFYILSFNKTINDTYILKKTNIHICVHVVLNINVD